jgi:PAS domain S-box-containing protein
MGQKILVVDTNADSLKKIIEIINNNGQNHTIEKTSSLEKIESDAIRFEPELVILSIESKKQNSAETVNTLRTISQLRNTPILLLTEQKDDPNLLKGFEMGIFDVLFKPFEPVELVVRVESILAKNNFFLRFLKQAQQIEQISNIASKSSNSVAIISPQGRIEWVNQGFTDMYECTFREFKQKFEKDLYSPEKNKNFSEVLTHTIKNKSNVVYENKWTTPKGNEKWIHTTLTPIFDEMTGNIIDIIAIESDVSELKKTEEKLEEQNKYLLKFTRHLETTNEILEKQRIEIEKERQKSEELLLNILPYPVAKQLMSKGFSNLRTYKLVSVMFTDFQGFTKLSEQLEVQELITNLSEFFEKFDEITSKHFIEKIKTIGDSYMCAGGLPLRNKSNPIDVVIAGLEIQEFMKEKNKELEKQKKPLWNLRLGIHSGEVIAGVIGKKKFAYDIWGDCVNTASRMESSSEIGQVNISGGTYNYIKDYFECIYRGKIQVKHKGDIEMYYVNRLKPEYAADEKGLQPNEKFNKVLASY